MINKLVVGLWRLTCKNAMITDDKVTEIYCMADDFCHTIELGSNKKDCFSLIQLMVKYNYTKENLPFGLLLKLL